MSGAVESTRCLDMIHHDPISNIYIYVRSRTIMDNQRGDDFVHIYIIYVYIYIVYTYMHIIYLVLVTTYYAVIS